MELDKKTKEKIISAFVENRLKGEHGEKILKEFGTKENYKRFFSATAEHLFQVFSQPSKK